MGPLLPQAGSRKLPYPAGGRQLSGKDKSVAFGPSAFQTNAVGGRQVTSMTPAPVVCFLIAYALPHSAVVCELFLVICFVHLTSRVLPEIPGTPER